VDQLASMRTFMRVADLGSFTRAADALGFSRAVVSTHVADLERHLGVKLLHRTTRKVNLTPDGTEYLERCRRILAEVEAAEETVRRTRLKPQGKLRIDVPTEFGRRLLVPALGQFTARYPDLSLEVQYNDRVVDLFEEQVDLAVRVGPIGHPNLVARRVCRTRLLTCASPAYLEEHGIPLEPTELRGHRLVGALSGTTGRPRKWVFQKGRHRLALTLPFALAFNTAEAQVNAAIRGAGIVQTSDMLLANHVVARRLEIILSAWSAEGAPISIVYPATLRNSLKIRVFADFAAGLLLESRARVDELLTAG
jgi:LysR family transcriptional regulator, regulator for bpeEF and oprC